VLGERRPVEIVDADVVLNLLATKRTTVLAAAVGVIDLE
jgi:hypothetical protein